MEERNLDLEAPISPEQWEQLARTASRLGVQSHGIGWAAAEPHAIAFHIRETDNPAGWSRFLVSDRNAYGTSSREVATVRFNDGRPYVELQTPESADEPAITEAEERAMREELERWARGKWHELLRESGLHFDREHIPQD